MQNHMPTPHGPSECRTLHVAYSPCPNDTFMFNDLATGVLRPEGWRITTHLHDVETLNQQALQGNFDVSKVSFYTYLLIKDHYELLSVGGALGFGCGPLVIAKRPMSSDELTHCRIAIPGELTTAHLLFRLWAPQSVTSERIFVPYHRIIPLVSEGAVDCGVLIHESRFAYDRFGLQCLVDLGAFWEQKTRLPIPLGGIVMRKSLGQPLIKQMEALLKQSIVNALADPEHTWQYVRQHAQEMELDILQKHIQMFVNSFSLDLGQIGRDAISTLDKMASRAGALT